MQTTIDQLTSCLSLETVPKEKHRMNDTSDRFDDDNAEAFVGEVAGGFAQVAR